MKEIINSSLFHGIESQDLDTFFKTFTIHKKIKRGEILFRKNDIGQDMYLILSGKLSVEIADDNDPQKHKFTLTIEQGAVIGELCVFGQKTRSATISAAEDSQLLVIDGEEFRTLIHHKKDTGALLISHNIATLLCQRLINANDFINKMQKSQDTSGAKSELEFYRTRFYDESLFN